MQGLPHMQLPNGCFRNTADSDEADMRFVFCAAAIAHMLGAVSFDVPKTDMYIHACKGYDGAFAQVHAVLITTISLIS